MFKVLGDKLGTIHQGMHISANIEDLGKSIGNVCVHTSATFVRPLALSTSCLWTECRVGSLWLLFFAQTKLENSGIKHHHCQWNERMYQYPRQDRRLHERGSCSTFSTWFTVHKSRSLDLLVDPVCLFFLASARRPITPTSRRQHASFGRTPRKSNGACVLSTPHSCERSSLYFGSRPRRTTPRSLHPARTRIKFMPQVTRSTSTRENLSIRCSSPSRNYRTIIRCWCTSRVDSTRAWLARR